MTDGAVTPFVAVNDESSYAPVTEFTTVGLGADETAAILAESVAR